MTGTRKTADEAIAALTRCIELILGPSIHPDCAAVIEVMTKAIRAAWAQHDQLRAENDRLFADWQKERAGRETFQAAYEEIRAERQRLADELDAAGTEWAVRFTARNGHHSIQEASDEADARARLAYTRRRVGPESAHRYTLVQRRIGPWQAADIAGETGHDHQNPTPTPIRQDPTMTEPDSYSSPAEPDETVSVSVMYVEGTGPAARARLRPPGAPALWAPADDVAEGSGIPVAELPGRRVLAVVRGGELAGFRPVAG